MLNYPLNYENDFDPSKNRTGILEVEDSYVFGIDANVARSMMEQRIRSIGDGVYSDGDRVEGCSILVNSENGDTHVETGKIYFLGMVRTIPAGDLNLPAVGRLQVGMVLERRIITSADDPNLIFKNQAYDAHNKPRCSQIQETPRWGLSTEPLKDTGEVEYRFVPVYEIENRIVLDNSPPPEASGVNGLLARYDYERNGHYIAAGFKATLMSATAELIRLSVSEGTANVRGIKIDRAAAYPMSFAPDPDLETIAAEPHFFNDGGTGSLSIRLNRTPIAEIKDISVLEEKTVDVLRGQSSGGRDPLPDAQVARVTAVKQSTTTYQSGTDFQQVGDEIDWSALGAEPNTGTTYQVTYEYKRSIAPISQTDETVVVSGAVTGSQVDIDYTWKMPRIDSLTVDTSGNIKRIKGIASVHSPAAPNAPDNELLLAEIHHDWANDPKVYNVGVPAVTVKENHLMRDLAIQNTREIARLQLLLEATNASGFAKSAIFADNFDDDLQRDTGIAQTLAIANGFLTLPIEAEVTELAVQEPAFNSFELSAFLVQDWQTGGMRVNPYGAFEPLPPKMTLTPATDSWTSTVSQFGSDITRRLADWTRTIGRGWRATSTSQVNMSTSVQLAGSTVREDEQLRVKEVGYEVEGLGPNEAISSITFDGIELLPNPAPRANADGLLNSSFTIPAGLPAGAKQVRIESVTGAVAMATYVGRGQITVNEFRRVTTVQRVTTVRRFDPLGYIWAPAEGIHLARVDVKVAEIGDPNKPLTLQIRRAQFGEPVGDPLTEVEHSMVGVQKGQILSFDLKVPIWLEANETYSHVWLTDDMQHELAIAELGKFDPARGWVRRQPDVNLVTISSSNNAQFVQHHDRDLWTRIFEAKYTETERTVTLGQLPKKAVTDILPLAGIDTPQAETAAEFIFEKQNGGRLLTAPGSTLTLAETLDEELDVKCTLKGSQKASAVLFSNPQIVTGVVQPSGNYVSRGFRCGTNRTVEISTLSRTPGASSFEIKVKTAANTFTAASEIAVEDVGDGWFKRIYRLEGVSIEITAIEIIANGSARDRPLMAHYHAAPLEI